MVCSLFSLVWKLVMCMKFVMVVEDFFVVWIRMLSLFIVWGVLGGIECVIR